MLGIVALMTAHPRVVRLYLLQIFVDTIFAAESPLLDGLLHDSEIGAVAAA